MTIDTNTEPPLKERRETIWKLEAQQCIGYYIKKKYFKIYSMQKAASLLKRKLTAFIIR